MGVNRGITLDKLRTFSSQTGSLVTVDAPLFGSLMILNGKILGKGSAVEPEKVGRTPGFPPVDEIVAEATRFWIQHENGIREKKTRDEMAKRLVNLGKGK